MQWQSLACISTSDPTALLRSRHVDDTGVPQDFGPKMATFSKRLLLKMALFWPPLCFGILVCKKPILLGFADLGVEMQGFGTYLR